jgi:plasmid stability protein
MPNLSIKNVPEHVVEKLRQRAASHHRSLQGELMDLICRSTDEDASETTSIDKDGDSSGWLSIDEIAAELATSQRRSSPNVPLAVDIIRQERDSR